MDRLLKPKEVAQRLQISMSTLRHWRKAGKGPRAIILSKVSFRYKQEDVDVFLQEQRNLPAASGSHP